MTFGVVNMNVSGGARPEPGSGQYVGSTFFIYGTGWFGPQLLGGPNVTSVPLTAALWVERRMVRSGAHIECDNRVVTYDTVALTAIPEPSTYVLLATGLLGLADVAPRTRTP
jgi:hypothetical protein